MGNTVVIKGEADGGGLFLGGLSDDGLHFCLCWFVVWKFFRLVLLLCLLFDGEFGVGIGDIYI